MEKILYIVRGIPGSGKSTFAKTLGGTHHETDNFFMVDGEYKFDVTKLKAAHEWCQNKVKTDMMVGREKIVVSNTFTQEWEMEYYLELAKTYGYKTFSIVVENRHGGVNDHNVPDEVLTKMRDRFEIKL
jgi:predicted kinase